MSSKTVDGKVRALWCAQSPCAGVVLWLDAIYWPPASITGVGYLLHPFPGSSIFDRFGFLLPAHGLSTSRCTCWYGLFEPSLGLTVLHFYRIQSEISQPFSDVHAKASTRQPSLSIWCFPTLLLVGRCRPCVWWIAEAKNSPRACVFREFWSKTSSGASRGRYPILVSFVGLERPISKPRITSYIWRTKEEDPAIFCVQKRKSQNLTPFPHLQNRGIFCRTSRLFPSPKSKFQLDTSFLYPSKALGKHADPARRGAEGR